MKPLPACRLAYYLGRSQEQNPCSAQRNYEHSYPGFSIWLQRYYWSCIIPQYVRVALVLLDFPRIRNFLGSNGTCIATAVINAEIKPSSVILYGPIVAIRLKIPLYCIVNGQGFRGNEWNSIYQEVFDFADVQHCRSNCCLVRSNVYGHWVRANPQVSDNIFSSFNLLCVRHGWVDCYWGLGAAGCKCLYKGRRLLCEKVSDPGFYTVEV